MIRRNALKTTTAALATFAAMVACTGTSAVAATTVYRVNAGGPVVAGAPAWTEDSQALPSSYVNAVATKNLVASTNATLDVTGPSVPVGTPAVVFRTARRDPIGRAEMQWSFPAPAGPYEVNLYFAETSGAEFGVGRRVFDVLVENQVALDHFDIFAAAGAGNRGVVKTIAATSDGTLNVNFRHQVGDPLVSAIEIVSPSAAPPPPLSSSPASLAFASVAVGSESTAGVQLTNTAVNGSVSVGTTTVAGTDASSFSDSFDDASPVILAPGESTTITVHFAPTSAGIKSASLQVAHDGAASPLTVPLGGTGEQPPPPPGTGSWTTGTPMPTDLGEVSVGVIGNQLYLVGQDDNRTLAYNLTNRTWQSKLAMRPYLGNHHGAEVINGEFYLFGGNTAGGGKVQIYNPQTNTWRLGADIPISSGSAATALISGKVYYAGGESPATAQAAVYDPLADSWAMIAPMPRGVTHAAAGTDGQKLWVFGGRGGGPTGRTSGAGSASNLVQIYDPATDTWESSGLGSMLAPFPVARGGMGKAVYANGRFSVMGGEDLANSGGATPTGAYNRVDVYDVAANTWSVGTPMPTARHGIFPVLNQGRIYVAGGGVKALHSSSTILEIYAPGS